MSQLNLNAKEFIPTAMRVKEEVVVKEHLKYVIENEVFVVPSVK
jgi:hypothetical protein